MQVKIVEAARLISEGKCVAVPTETVYGLAASVSLEEAITKLYEIKKRSPSQPTTIVINSIDDLKNLTENLPPHTLELANTFWPGPLTLVLPANCNCVPASLRGGRTEVGIRIPDHPDLLNLIRLTGPLALPSANPKGVEPPTKMEEVAPLFSTPIPVIDGGECTLGLHSTLLKYDENKWWVLREGSLPIKSFTHILGYEPQKRIIDN